MLVELDEVMTFLKSELAALIEDDAFGFAEALLSIMKDMESYEWNERKAKSPMESSLPLFPSTPVKAVPLLPREPGIKLVGRMWEVLRSENVTVYDVYSKLKAEILGSEAGSTMKCEDIENKLVSFYPFLTKYRIGKCGYIAYKAIARNFINYLEDNPLEGAELLKQNGRIIIKRSP